MNLAQLDNITAAVYLLYSNRLFASTVCFVLMPRKKINKRKQPLRFVEPPAGGARVYHSGPDVRAALNPKDFFTEAQEQNGSALNAWVTPQFDTSAPAPVKRQRGKLSSTIQGNFSQLSRKNIVNSSRFPTLLFETKGDHHQKQRKKVLDNGISSASNDEIKSHHGNSKKGTTLSRTCGRSCIPSEASLSHASVDHDPVQIASALPHVVTPNISEERSSANTKPLSGLWFPPCTLSSNHSVDVLVPDSPESDYGVKVTWRRRKKLMRFLKEKGFLSDSEALIHA